MRFLQELEGNPAIAKSVEKTYFNVTFHESFGAFLEALRCEKLILEDTQRVVVERGHLWADCRRQEGIMVITEDNPLLTKATKRMIVGATRSTLELFEHVLSRYATYCITEDIEPDQIKVNAQYHEKLNPLFWDEYEDGPRLKDDIRKKMLDISDAFCKYLKMPEMHISDIILTGSNANFNWTDESDVDLHVIVDMNQVVNVYGQIVPEYLETKRRLWNDQHEITLHDKNVEIYVQDEQEPHTSSGIYSLKQNAWVTEPKYEKPEYDTIAVRTKIAKFVSHIDDLIDSEQCDPRCAEDMINKLKRYRKAGLQKSGEFSVENLVFKYLRNNGYLEKISECKRQGIDSKLSIEDEEWWKK